MCGEGRQALSPPIDPLLGLPTATLGAISSVTR